MVQKLVDKKAAVKNKVGKGSLYPSRLGAIILNLDYQLFNYH